MPRRAPPRTRPSLDPSLRLPETPANWLNTDWMQPLKRTCIREVCKKEFDVTAPNQRVCPKCQDDPLYEQERRRGYYVNVELPDIDRVYELHNAARAKRCPPKTKDCVVAVLYDKSSRDDIVAGRKILSGKLGTVIVMVATLYDKIGGDDVLADAHAKCRKTFVANRSVVTCSDECSDAWHVIYRSGYDETNRDEINKERRDKLAANSDEINRLRREKTASRPPDIITGECGHDFEHSGRGGKPKKCPKCRKRKSRKKQG
jgi:hypothetical protein